MVGERDFKAACGQFATGVTIVTTTTAAGEPVGVTINSFSSVSLDPPLVLFCLDRDAGTYAAFESCQAFAVNILSRHQMDLSVRFSRPQPQRFDDLAHFMGETGAPVLEECIACLECTREAAYEGGDHVILVGRVAAVHQRDGNDPLLYFGGRYATLGPDA